MMQLLKFDSLVTPSIIKFLFYIGIAGSGLASLAIILSGLGAIMRGSLAEGVGITVGGLIVVLLGIVFSRVSCEIMLVVFMIRDELAWQRENSRTLPAPSPAE